MGCIKTKRNTRQDIINTAYVELSSKLEGLNSNLDSALARDYTSPEDILREVNRVNKMFEEDFISYSGDVVKFNPSEFLVDYYHNLIKEATIPIEQVNYTLKVVKSLDSIAKDRKVIRLNTKDKPYIEQNLRKKLSGTVPSDQIDLIFDTIRQSGKTEMSTDDVIASLLANNSFAVEINLSKEKKGLGEQPGPFEVTGHAPQFTLDGNIYKMRSDLDFDDFGISLVTNFYKNNKEISSKEFGKAKEEAANQGIPTKHYQEYTTPGGINYKEYEISTPGITPSIKGHASFSTNNGIGWVRVDETASYDEAEIAQLEYQGASREEAMKELSKMNFALKKGNVLRVQEFQSDLFQKGRDKKDLIRDDKADSRAANIQQDDFRTNVILGKDGFSYVADVYNNEYYKIKRKDNKDSSVQGYNTVEGTYKEITREDFIKNTSDIDTSKENQFLQLLNKKNNWVTFFIKSLVQDSVKKGYEKILFPKGKTAAKVEGHETLEEFKKIKEDRIKELEKKLNGEVWTVSDLYDDFLEGIVNFNSEKEAQDHVDSIGRESLTINKLKVDEKSINREIKTLKDELKRIEGPEGMAAFKPIEAFYEKTVTNILKKTYGAENVKTFTDEYGNSWSELTLEKERDLSDINFSKSFNDAPVRLSEAEMKIISAGSLKIDGLTSAQTEAVTDFIFKSAMILSKSREDGPVARQTDLILKQITDTRDKKLALIDRVIARSGDTNELAVTREKISSFYKGITDNFDQLLGRAKIRLAEVSKVRDIGGNLSDINEEEGGQVYSGNQFDVSPSDHLGTKLKGELYGIRKFDNGKPKNLAGLPVYEDIDKVFSTLLKLVTDKTDNFAGMIDLIKAEQARLDQLYSGLNVAHNSEWLGDAVDIFEKLDEQTQNAFFHALYNQNVKFLTAQVDNKNDNLSFKVMEVNRSSNINETKDTWTKNYRNFINTATTEEIEEVLNSFIEARKEANENRGTEATLDAALRPLGIVLNRATLTKIVNTTGTNPETDYKNFYDKEKKTSTSVSYDRLFKNEIGRPFGQIMMHLIEMRETDKNERKDVVKVPASNSTIARLASENVDNSTDNESLNTRDGSKARYTSSKPNLFSETNKSLKDKTYVDNLKSDPYFETLYWLQEGVHSTINNVYAAINSFLVKGKKFSKDTTIASLSRVDQEMLRIMLAFSSKGYKKDNTRKMHSLLMTPSNKVTDPVIEHLSLKKFYKVEDGVLVKDDKMMDVVYDQLVMPEINRMASMTEAELNRSTFNPYMFYIIPELNGARMQSSDFSLIEYLMKPPSFEGVYKNYKTDPSIKKEIDQIAKRVMIEHIDKLVLHKVAEWKELGISKGNSIPIIPKAYTSNLKGLTREAMALDYIVNGLVANVNQSVYFGDIAYFAKQEKGTPLSKLDNYMPNVKRTTKNLHKRLAFVIAPGSKLAKLDDSFSDNYIQISMEDPKGWVKNREYYKRIGSLGMADTIMDVADAEEYETLSERLYVLMGKGKISRKKYDELIKISNTPGAKYSEGQLKLLLTPEKPVYAGLVKNEFGKMVPHYIKSSSIPLIPHLTHGLEIDKLRLYMEAVQKKSGKTVRASYKTANKLGSHEKATVAFDGNENFNMSLFEDLEKVDFNEVLPSGMTVLDRNHFRIQSENPVKSEKSGITKIKNGTQERKMLWSNLLDIEGKVFTFKGVDYPAKELKKKYNDFYDELFSLNRSILYQELDINLDGVRGPEFVSRLQDLLYKEAVKRNYPVQDIQGLKIDLATNSFIMPPWFAASADNYESLLNSIISNRISISKFPGYAFILGSEIGFKKEITEAESYDASQSEMVWIDPLDKELTMEVVDGVPSYGVLVSPKFKLNSGGTIDLLKKDKKGYIYVEKTPEGYKLNTEKLPLELLKMFGFRIPTSGQMSMANLIIKGFLPSNSADLMVAPRDFITLMGSDFDVDKLYAYMFHYYTDAEGSLKKLTEESKEDYAENKANSTLKKTDGISKILKEKRSTNVEKYALIKELRNELAHLEAFMEDTEGAEGKLILALAGVQDIKDLVVDIDAVKLELETSTEGLKELNEKYDKLVEEALSKKLEQVSDLKAKILASSELQLKLVQNDIIDIHFSVFESKSKEVQSRLKTTLDTDINEAAAVVMEEALDKSSIVEDQVAKPYSPFSQTENRDKKSSADLGAAGTGYFSLAVTFFSLLQEVENKVRMFTKNEEGEIVPFMLSLMGQSYDKKNFLGDTMNLNKDALISKKNSEDQSSFIDHEGLQIIQFLGGQKEFFPVLMLMNFMGFGTADVEVIDIKVKSKVPVDPNKPLPKRKVKVPISALFLNQPSVKKALFESKGSLLDAFDDRVSFKESIDNISRQLYEDLLKSKYSKLSVLDPNLESEKAFTKSKDMARFLVEKKMSSQEFYDIIGSSVLTQDMAFVQLGVLDILQDLMEYGTSLQTVMNSLTPESRGMNKNFHGTYAEIDTLYQSFQSNPLFTDAEGNSSLMSLLGEVKDNRIFTSILDLIPGTLQGSALKNSFSAFLQMFEGVSEDNVNRALFSIPHGGDTMKNIIKKFKQITGKSEEDYFSLADSSRLLWNDIKRFTFASLIEDSANVRKKLMKGSTENHMSLAKYVESIQTAKNAPAFLKLLKKDVRVYNEHIIYDSSQAAGMDEGYIWESYLGMFTDTTTLEQWNGEEMSMSKLAEYLAEYSILEGFITEARQFNRFVPITYLKAKGYTDKLHKALKGFNNNSLDALKGSTINHQVPPLLIQMIQHFPHKAAKYDTGRSKDITYLQAPKTIPVSRVAEQYNIKKLPYFVTVKLSSKGMPGNKPWALYMLADADTTKAEYIKIPVLGSLGTSEYDPSKEIAQTMINTESSLNSVKETSKSNLPIKEGISEVFNENKELSKIGTEQQYSDYLDTVFPESKVKDIVYHSRKTAKNILNKERNKSGFYFGTKDQADLREEQGGFDGFTQLKAVINLIAPTNTTFDSRDNDKQQNILKNKVGDTVFLHYNHRKTTSHKIQDIKNYPNKTIITLISRKDKVSIVTVTNGEVTHIKLSSGEVNPSVRSYKFKFKFEKNLGDSLIINVSKQEAQQLINGREGYNLENFSKEYVVFKPEQIHILGSKQDVQGFKNFTNNNSTQTEAVPNGGYVQSAIPGLLEAKKETTKDYDAATEIRKYYNARKDTMSNSFQAFFEAILKSPEFKGVRLAPMSNLESVYDRAENIALYRQSNRTIYFKSLANASPEVVLEEMVHSVTKEKILKDKELKKALVELHELAKKHFLSEHKTISSEDLTAFSKAIVKDPLKRNQAEVLAIKKIEAIGKGNVAYTLSSLTEFIGRIHTNRHSIEYFSSVSIKSGNLEVSLLDKIMELVKKAANSLGFTNGDNLVSSASSVILDSLQNKITMNSTQDIKKTTSKQTDETINIYAGTNENSHLSNFAERPFTNRHGKKYNTVEGAFQAAKIAYTKVPGTYHNGNTETNAWHDMEDNLSKATGGIAKALGRSIKDLNIKEWDKNAVSEMKELIKFSFEQNPKALQQLLDTGNATLTHTQDNSKWGKLFPKLLMEVRSELSGTQQTTSTNTSSVVREKVKANMREAMKGKSAEKHLPKELKKVDVANQFIGEGLGSTNSHRQSWQKRANTGIYKSSDIIMLAANGNRSGRFKPVINGVLQGEYKNIDKAIVAGASFVADTANHLKGTYNVGEKELAEYLTSKGYTRDSSTGVGFWSPATQQTTEAKDTAQGIVDSTGLMGLPPEAFMTTREDLDILDQIKRTEEDTGMDYQSKNFGPEGLPKIYPPDTKKCNV